MSVIAQKVYSLLPTLLHYHHPLIPGYLQGNVPHGICFYTPNRIQQQYLKEFFLYFDVHSKKLSMDEFPIIGIYSMGSTSSVGQNYSSDIDIWVCHQSWLDFNGRQLLQYKCNLIENWAATFGVKVNCYLIDENLFRHHANYYYLGKKEYDLTYSILLLDEFYRTAVRLAGKRILWNMVPENKEEYYNDYVMSLCAKDIVMLKEWIDFGGLTSLSFEEYFGATLWQIHKSINSPYKSILKILLLEAYFWKYPFPQLLARDIKRRLHNGEIVSFGLDPYCMMLDCVTEYLQTIDDKARLDLVRRCFYLKVCEKLSSKKVSVGWRREVVRQLVQKWGWNVEKVVMLDNCANWESDQIHEVHHEVFDAIKKSFRNLMHFVNRTHLDVSSTPKDIGLLVCKLRAACYKTLSEASYCDAIVNLIDFQKPI